MSDHSATRVPTVDVVIISWQGMRESSLRIAAQLDGMPGVRLRIIYSNAAEAPEQGPGLWQQVSNAKYFGLKFEAALADFAGDVLLLIQADALFTDWPLVVARCQSRFAQRPLLGMWAPRLDYTPWTPDRVDVRPLGDQGLTAVAQTDGIVLAFSASTIKRMSSLDYGCNNLGWGIDWLAICHCYVNGLEVLREDGLTIVHPPSRGYAWREAVTQWRAFMRQMNDEEQAMYQILLRYTAERRRGWVGKLLSSLAKRRAGRKAIQLECELSRAAAGIGGRSNLEA